MAQRNNPYYNQIMQGRGSTDLVYQPEDNSEMIDRYANLLQQRQGEFDTSKARMAEAQGRFGETDTYDPNMLNDRVDQFTGGVEKMVQDRYNGDWGAASSEILKSISKERGADFYKYNKYLNEQAKQQQQAKSKYGDNFITTQDLTRQGLLGEAIQSQDPYGMLSANNYERPDYGKVAFDYAKQVKPNTINELIKDLNPADKAAYKQMFNEDPQGFFRSISATSNKSNLKDAVGEIESIMYNDNKNVLLAEYGTEKAAKEALKPMIESATGLAGYYQETEKLNTKPKTETPKVTTNNDYARVGGYTHSTGKKFEEDFKDEYSGVNLDNPDYKKDKNWVSKTWDFIKAGATNTDSEKIEAESEKKYLAKIKKVTDEIDNYEKLYPGVFSGVDNYNNKGALMNKIKDNTNTYQELNMSLGLDQPMIGKINNALTRLHSLETRNPKTGKYEKVENDKDVDMPGMWDKNTTIADYETHSLNPLTGAIFAKHKTKPGRTVEGYLTVEAEQWGLEMRSIQDKIDKNGFAVSNKITSPEWNNSNGLPMETISLKVYDEQEQAEVMYTVPNDPRLAVLSRSQIQSFAKKYGKPTTKLTQDNFYKDLEKLGFTEEFK